MTGLRYDEAALVQSLNQASAKSRVAFAAACAERLFPAYAHYCDRVGVRSPEPLASSLARIWRHLLGEEMSMMAMRAEIDRCEALIPEGRDVAWIEEQPYADDAAAAVAYALRALASSDPQEAAWAARHAYESAEYHVDHRLGFEGEQATRHPIVQTELARQRHDLDELSAVRHESEALFIRIRDRAKAEGHSFFASQAPG